jgi:hypothetical protein
MLNIAIAICTLVACVAAVGKFARNQAGQFVGAAVHDSLSVHVETHHRRGARAR